MNAMQSQSSNGAYVYCVVRAEPFLDGAPPLHSCAVGEAEHPVRAIQFMDVAALVSDSSASRYDVSRQNTLAHQLVVEEAMARSDVLPVRFSTVAKSERDVLEKLLKRKFGEFHYLLQYVHDRIELGVKVFWDRKTLFAGITAEDSRLRSLRDSIAGRTPEETHYQRIQLGQLTEEAISRRRECEAEAILAALRPLAVEFKVNKILTDMMILNAAFLVDRSLEPAFDAAVSTLHDAYVGRLIFKYAGPLPPYNFVNVTVRWEDE